MTMWHMTCDMLWGEGRLGKNPNISRFFFFKWLPLFKLFFLIQYFWGISEVMGGKFMQMFRKGFQINFTLTSSGRGLSEPSSAVTSTILATFVSNIWNNVYVSLWVLSCLLQSADVATSVNPVVFVTVIYNIMNRILRHRHLNIKSVFCFKPFLLPI